MPRYYSLERSLNSAMEDIIRILSNDKDIDDKDKKDLRLAWNMLNRVYFIHISERLREEWKPL